MLILPNYNNVIYMIIHYLSVYLSTTHSITILSTTLSLIKHDKHGKYCRKIRECAVLDHVPDFFYVCGGSGILLNRWVDR